MKIIEYLFNQSVIAAGSNGGELVTDSSGQNNHATINAVRNSGDIHLI